MECVASRREKAGSGAAVLAGQRVLLRPVSASDLPVLGEWDEDPEIIALMGRRFAAESPHEWLQTLQRGRSCRAWVIVVEERPIGEVELAQINHRSSTAEIRICIGERTHWGQGIGTEVMAHVLAFAFDSLKLSSLYLRVFANNVRAIALYERLGFRKEAVLRPSERRNDPAPVVLMTLTGGRWRGQRQSPAV